MMHHRSNLLKIKFKPKKRKRYTLKIEGLSIAFKRLSIVQS